MKKVALFSTMLFAAVTTANAADITPVKDPYNWTGIHAGLFGGAGFGSSRHFNAGASTTDFSTSGTLGGIDLGYDFQTQKGLVLGIEGDFALANVNGSTLIPCAAPNCYTTMNELGTLRGRLGFAQDNFMLYGTGGLALGNFNVGAGTSPDFNKTISPLGWTVGAGVEYAVSEHVSARLQYLYANFGTSTYGPGAPLNVSVTNQESIVTFGLNYKF